MTVQLPGCQHDLNLPSCTIGPFDSLCNVCNARFVVWSDACNPNDWSINTGDSTLLPDKDLVIHE